MGAAKPNRCHGQQFFVSLSARKAGLEGDKELWVSGNAFVDSPNKKKPAPLRVQAVNK
ncbi:MAG TPA: hypothetical protein VEC12_03670 [Bacteroidia bacterium]|nr:hypothetical protein [Bacteroidia bacterium]